MYMRQARCGCALQSIHRFMTSQQQDKQCICTLRDHASVMQGLEICSSSHRKRKAPKRQHSVLQRARMA